MTDSSIAKKYNTVILLGPTAVGKTSLGVSLALRYGWDIISADSRQIYKGLDLGSGKDLKDYSGTIKNEDGSETAFSIPYHLIDVTTLASEFNVYNFQTEFYRLFKEFEKQNKMPFVVGGTGMYVDSICREYNFVEVPENAELRAELETKSLEVLDQMLLELKPDLHNKSDLLLRDRTIRAIEIALFMADEKKVNEEKEKLALPKVNPFVIGTTISRDELHSNIRKRLRERIEEGMIDEVDGLHSQGFSWERLEKLGLEYRFVSQYLEGKIATREEMESTLYHAIAQFAKRQETWFRGMERKGVNIHWLPSENNKQVKLEAAINLIEENLM